MPKEHEDKLCRKIYVDVLNGYSEFNYEERRAYLRHFTEKDFGLTEKEFFQYAEEARSKGLTWESEKLKLLIDNGHWDQSKEDALESVRGSIKEAEHSLQRVILESQIPGRKKFIGELQDKLYSLERERSDIMGITCEEFARKKQNEKIIYYSFFKDRDLTERLLTEKEFEELDQRELGEKVEIYNRISSEISERNISKIAVLPFFLNSFFLVNDKPDIFYGKPVSELTVYQINLFSKGKYYKSILSESEGKEPPDEDYKDLDKIVDWYDRQYSIIQGKRRKDAAEARAEAAKSNSGRKTRMR